MSLREAVYLYLFIGLGIAAAKIEEKSVRPSVSVMIGLTWPLYVVFFIAEVTPKWLARVRGR